MSDIIIRRRALLGGTRNTETHECMVEFNVPREDNRYPDYFGTVSISKVNWPEGITSISEYFLYCSEIDAETISNIPDTVTYIGKNAFAYCRNLTGSVTLPANLENVCDYAFYYDNGITSLTLPEVSCRFGYYSIYPSSNLTTINATEGVVYAFAYYSGITNTKWYSNKSNGNVYLGNNYIGYKGTMPANTNITLEPGTTSIAASAFTGKTTLKSITIPDTVQYIGPYAFSGCTGLTSITIPESLNSDFYSTSQFQHFYQNGTNPNNISSTNINDFGSLYSPFYSGKCTGITTINYNAINFTNPTPSTSTTGGQNFFPPSQFPNVTTVNIGNNVQTIPQAFIPNFTKVTSITIPNSVKRIGDNAFYGCTGLTSITIPESVEEVGKTMIQACGNITTINYNAINASGDVNNRDGIFGTTNFSKLTALNIGNQVQKIPENFLNGSSIELTNITFPSSLRTIGYAAFAWSSITNFNFTNTNLTTIDDYAFVEASYIETISFPSTLTTLGRYAFSDCAEIVSIDLSNTQITELKLSTFSGDSSLTTVDLPSTITSIANSVFSSCNALSSITIRATTPPSLGSSYSNLFPSLSKTYTIYVPASSVDTYKTASRWSYYSSKIQAIPS